MIFASHVRYERQCTVKGRGFNSRYVVVCRYLSLDTNESLVVSNICFLFALLHLCLLRPADEFTRYLLTM